MGDYSPPAGGGGLTVIQRQVLAAPVATVTFSSIPQTYENLILEVVGRTSDAAVIEGLNLQFNGDSGANYDWELGYFAGATTNPSGGMGATSIAIGALAAANAPANQGGSLRLFIPGYARSVFNKTCVSLNAWVSGTATNDLATETTSGNWRNNAAITSLSVTDGGGGNFIVGSVFSLYGES